MLMCSGYELLNICAPATQEGSKHLTKPKSPTLTTNLPFLYAINMFEGFMSL